MQANVMQITPEVASSMLSHNTKNRPLRTRVVQSYAEDMRNGNWEETSQAITFDKDGNLMDGQHRLNAVINSGVSVSMLVITDMPRSGMYDAGLTRSISDRIIMSGTDIPSSITTSFMTSVCNFLVNIKTGNNKQRISTAKVRDFMIRNADKLSIISDVVGTQRKNGITVAPVVAAMLSSMSVGASAEKLRRFYEVLMTGISLSEDEKPVIALRNKLLVDGMRSRQNKLEQYKRTQFALKHFFGGGLTTRNVCPRDFLYSIDFLFEERESGR